MVVLQIRNREFILYDARTAEKMALNHSFHFWLVTYISTYLALQLDSLKTEARIFNHQVRISHTVMCPTKFFLFGCWLDLLLLLIFSGPEPAMAIEASNVLVRDPCKPVHDKVVELVRVLGDALVGPDRPLDLAKDELARVEHGGVR